MIFMNKQRRKEISECLTQLEEIKERLENTRDDEEFAFDNLPENLQGSTKGEEMEDAIGYLEEAISNIDDTIDELNNIN